MTVVMSGYLRLGMENELTVDWEEGDPKEEISWQERKVHDCSDAIP